MQRKNLDVPVSLELVTRELDVWNLLSRRLSSRCVIPVHCAVMCVLFCLGPTVAGGVEGGTKYKASLSRNYHKFTRYKKCK